MDDTRKCDIITSAGNGFEKSNNMKDGTETAREIFNRHHEMLIGVKGLDKKPWIYPLGKASEINGIFYWLCDKSTQLYGALSINEDAQIYIEDGEDVIRITGKAVFSEDEKVISECLKEQPGKDPVYQIAFFMKDASLAVTGKGESTVYVLKTSDDVLSGIEMKKDKEIRDRLAKIIGERAEREVTDKEYQKFFDGALLVFGECAKKLWPSFNLMQLESVLLYETYDEREKYQNRAAVAIGNIAIKQVEDLSYYLSEEVFGEALNEIVENRE